MSWLRRGPALCWVRLICLRAAAFGGGGLAARHDVPYVRIHSLLGVARHAARRVLRTGLVPSFVDGGHHWLLAVFPRLGAPAGRKRRGPAKPAPQSIPS